jgi:hypothetical protein
MKTNISNTNDETLRIKFMSMLKGSKSAKYLSIIYTVISFVFAFKFRTELEVAIPLILSGALVLWFSLTHLWLKGIKGKPKTKEELIASVLEYKRQTLRREKYEQYVFAFWLLTLVPVFLDGKTITSFFVIKLLVVFYFFIIIGNGAFKKVKAQLVEMDHLMRKTI